MSFRRLLSFIVLFSSFFIFVSCGGSRDTVDDDTPKNGNNGNNENNGNSNNNNGNNGNNNGNNGNNNGNNGQTNLSFTDIYNETITGTAPATIVDPSNRSIVRTFDEMLDREISFLAQDILLRLHIIYGTGFTGINDGRVDIPLNAYFLKDSLTGRNYVVDGKTALLRTYNLLSYPDVISTNLVYFKFQGEIVKPQLNTNQRNMLNNNNTFALKYWSNYLADGLNSASTQYAIGGGRQNVINGKNSNAWKWTYTNLNNFKGTTSFNITESYRQFITEDNINKLKINIANIMSGGTREIESWDEKRYDEILTSINQIGWDNHSTKIEYFIKESIIGRNLIDADAKIKDRTDVDYKGYDITIPAIVEMAMDARLQDTTKMWIATDTKNDASIYLTDKTYVRVANEENNYTQIRGKKYNTLTIYPKNGADVKNIKLILTNPPIKVSYIIDKTATDEGKDADYTYNNMLYEYLLDIKSVYDEDPKFRYGDKIVINILIDEEYDAIFEIAE